MKTFTVEVTQTVTVTLDETKFDEAFMHEFRDSFLNFDTLEQHAEHIAYLEASSQIDVPWNDPFIEGYGPASEMGISAKVEGVQAEIAQVHA